MSKADILLSELDEDFSNIASVNIINGKELQVLFDDKSKGKIWMLNQLPAVTLKDIVLNLSINVSVNPNTYIKGEYVKQVLDKGSSVLIELENGNTITAKVFK